MKILRCHIENFGKLENLDYEFLDGLNTIKEENGFGKTTFANFIKAMFYGLDTKRSTRTLVDRKKFTPWQGGTFGGNIEFEVNNKRYKVERTFGKKESEDTFKLYNLTTNLESNDYSENLGEEIFKLNKEAYERSTFVSGQNIQISMNDSLNAKLGNILESENDINTSEQAIKALEEAVKIYKKTGGRGVLNEKIAQKTLLEKKLEQSRIDEKNLQERKKQNEEIKNQIRNKEQEQNQYRKMQEQKTEEEAKKAKHQNYILLKTSEEESRKKLDEYKKFFQPGIPTDEEIETLIMKSLSLERFKAESKNYETNQEDIDELNKLKKIFDDSLISEQEINMKIKQCNSLIETKSQIELTSNKVNNLNKEKTIFEKQIKKVKISKLALYFMSIILIATGVLIYLMNHNKLNFVFIVAGLLSLIIGIITTAIFKKLKKQILNKQHETKEIQSLQEKLTEEIDKTQKDIEDFINRYSARDITVVDNTIKITEIKTNYIKYINLKNSINKNKKQQDEVLKKLSELESSIKDYLLKYFNTLIESFTIYAQEIKVKKSEYLNQKKDYEKKLQSLEDFINENKIENIDITQGEENHNFNKSEIEKKIQEIGIEIDDLNDKKNYNKNQIEILESNLDSAFDIENELEELNQSIQEIKEKCAILEKTKKYLESAKNQFSSHYLGSMQESFTQNIKQITGNEMDIHFDVNLDVKINELGSSKEIRYFSTGYTDLIYICMRLSLIDALFQDEKPFIILDDPFVNLDETKINNALKMLKSVSEKYQIIYFVCHESRQ